MNELNEQIKNQLEEAKLYNKTYKRFINGFYGALANNYFKFFNLENAKSITAGGRYIIKSVAKNLQKLYGYENIYSDTDSIFLNLGKYCKNKYKNFENLSKDEQYKLVKQEINLILIKIKEIITKSLTDLNSFDTTVEMEFEMLSDYSLFFDVKKKYIMKKYEEDNIIFKDKIVLKVKNFDMIKSSTPEPIKKYLEEFINSIMTKNYVKAKKTYDELMYKIDNVFTPDEICVSNKVNTLEKYEDNEDILIFKKQTPLHVRASLIYNFIIDKYKLNIDKIREGDIVNYIYINPLSIRLKDNLDMFNDIQDIYVFGWKDKLAKEILDVVEFKIDTKKIKDLVNAEIKNIFNLLNDKIDFKLNPFAKKTLKGLF